VPDRLLALSVWADLRDDGGRGRLLVQVAARLGLRRVVIPTSGPLAGDRAATARLLQAAPPGLEVLARDPVWEAPDDARALGTWLPVWPERDLVAALPELRGAAELVVDVPVSVGRTSAEAAARAGSEPVFNELGSPATQGLFGRLEDAQEQVSVLAAAGVTELCCIVPAEDMLDHLAQLATVNVGHLDTHAPGSQRSPDPLPPVGWGGPERPVSA
jgi:hypothetical protein